MTSQTAGKGESTGRSQALRRALAHALDLVVPATRTENQGRAEITRRGDGIVPSTGPSGAVRDGDQTER
ncbi:MAG: hypothetical protein AVDCRST_MAG52-2685 [uncultured Blastococcus sp.]|uniref:Uncharacterized protein n=1 Tax=uncultured Blastococcus sp. TaxID=217144 RepID=A0A6J4IUU9_9ACTN|nr:MAG: hypothetical protein AVDCRST_MAG52-2685 [uncultured Blastococcus sp.]